MRSLHAKKSKRSLSGLMLLASHCCQVAPLLSIQHLQQYQKVGFCVVCSPHCVAISRAIDLTNACLTKKNLGCFLFIFVHGPVFISPHCKKYWVISFLQFLDFFHTVRHFCLAGVRWCALFPKLLCTCTRSLSLLKMNSFKFWLLENWPAYLHEIIFTGSWFYSALSRAHFDAKSFHIKRRNRNWNWWSVLKRAI